MTATEFQFKLVNLHEPLLSFAYKLTSDKDDAKDLVQETFLKALKNSDKFRDESNLKAWTYTILKNTFINNYRRSINRNTYFDQKKEGFYINNIPNSGSDDPDTIFISKELESAIDALDDSNKLPFKMHHAGYKYKEIADELNLKIGTVKSRIFFTKRKLERQMNS
jgi:RNA polymerase sigma-70 factor (ECF subfamily)